MFDKAKVIAILETKIAAATKELELQQAELQANRGKQDSRVHEFVDGVTSYAGQILALSQDATDTEFDYNQFVNAHYGLVISSVGRYGTPAWNVSDKHVVVAQRALNDLIGLRDLIASEPATTISLNAIKDLGLLKLVRYGR